MTGVNGVPKFIYDVYRGDTSALTETPSSEFIDRGLYFSIQCPEDLLQVSQAEFDALFAQVPSYLITYTYRSQISSPRMPEFCGQWGLPQADPIIKERVTSTVYTLIVEGNFDLNTPPSWGASAAQGLTNSYMITVPNLAHGGAGFQPCSGGIIAAFLDDPTTPPDTDCLSSMKVDFDIEFIYYMPIIQKQ
jgi:pimeloyl-ACP methyl ester carboxylesterase